MRISETSRLTITEFTTGDSEFILELLNTASWLKFIGDRKIKSIQDADNYILNVLIKGYLESGFGFYKVELKESGLAIGMCGIVKREHLDHPDIGFAFLEKYEGKGYGYESAMSIIEFARTKLAIETLSAITVPYNSRSIALLEKCGFRFQKNIHVPNDAEELMLFQNHLHNV